MLLTILLFSCDQTASCIDADDFGDIEREILTVYPAVNDKCSIPSGIGGHKEGYTGIVVESGAISTDPAKVLHNCLTTDATFTTNADGPDVLAQLGTKEDSKKTGCLAYTSETKILLCESFCETHCYDNSTPPNTQPNWLTNTPRGKDSDFGINITPGSQIFVSVVDGSINLSGGIVNPANVIGGTGQSSLFFSDMPQFPHTTSATPPFVAQAGYSYSPSIRSQYAFPPSATAAISIIGNSLTNIQRYEVLSRNIISFTPYPTDYPSVPIEANPDTWKCLEGFPNNKDKMKCSFTDDALGEDDYASYSATNNNLLSSRAFEVGTDFNIHKITNYGGFIRFNEDGANKNMVFFDLPKFTTSPAVEKFSDTSKPYDQFIDLKANEVECNNIPINISIIDKSNPNIIHYKSDNLILSSSSYTSKNIPFYSDSKIKIELVSGLSSSFANCTISVKSQKYLDIKMPISGFVQFKMKDLENISYGDLKGNYNTSQPSLQTNFMDCAPSNFVKSFYVNKDADGNFRGIGIECQSPAGRAVVNGGSAQYIGALSGTPQTITSSTTAGKEGFSKIQIIKDSDYINKIKFFPYDGIISAAAIHDSTGFYCDTKNNCWEISCNNSKISGIKAQFDGNSIKALSVICQTTQSQNSCDIYGRIINPHSQKIILPTPAPVAGTAIINDTNTPKQVFVKSETQAISIDKKLSNLFISDVFIGLNEYANKNHSEINTNGCQVRLENILGCEISNTNKLCEIDQLTKFNYSSFLSISNNGNGIEGSTNSNFGTGGGGGGNKEGIAGNNSSGGKAGESYINPEFINAPETTGDFGTNDDQGKIELIYNGSPVNISFNPSNNYLETSLTHEFNSGSTISYKIRGGSGGMGGNCNNPTSTYAGGAGGKGDSFQGTLDFTEALNRQASLGNNSRQLTFKIKLGKKGNDGKHCNYNTSASDQPINFSKNQDTGKLKGGNGGVSSISASASDDMATGGAGGSASYIALVRSDEAGNSTREDFLVIAGGGGGGNGAKKATTSPMTVLAEAGAAGETASSRSDQLKNNANIDRISMFTLSSKNECSHIGNGIEGTYSNFGTGGGGGGNKEGIAGNNSSGGKAGESYINPEFIKGVATSVNIPAGDDGQGKIVLTNEDGNEISIVNTNYTEQNITYLFPSGKNLINYKIYGGSGGMGGNCNNPTSTYAGGAGGKGDSFQGTLDFTEALNRQASLGNNSRQLTFKIKLGKKGNDGKHCNYDTSASDQPINFSKNQDTGKLKGGNGGGSSILASDDMATGGAGGSASYIALVRSDEAGNSTREDFLVIAGGGGGGNGAKKATTSPTIVLAEAGAAGETASSRSDQLKTKINGYRISIVFSPSAPTLTSGFNYDYYEYDDFITKTEANSEDPLKKLNVNQISYKPDAGIFVRKDQILRILPKTFETLWNSKEGPKECGVGMIMKITPRPAVLCLSGINETIINPACIPQYKTTTATVDSGGTASVGSAPASSTQEGCQGSYDCSLSPILKTVASIPSGSTYCPNTSCSAINCTGGTEENANNICAISSPTGCDGEIADANNPAILYKYTATTCENCRTQKENLAKTSPKIAITSACYNFEDKTNISVFRFLSQFNAAGNADEKTRIITVNNIPKISDFNEGQNFGNFASSESSNNNQFFKLKNPITVSQNGEFKGFVINNSDFKTLSIIPTLTNNATQITFTTQATYSKGKGLQMYLCKETDANGVDCNGAEPLPIANVKTKYIDGVPALDYFEFNASGKIQKKSTPVLPNICDQYASSQSDNFICFKDDLGNENEVKKYRLAFRIKDFYDADYSNNSGSYRVKIEKRNISSSRAGGIINGILEPIISNLDGKIDDPATPSVNESSEGIVKGFYLAIIQNSLYRWISSLTIVLALSFYGMGYLMGINEMKHSEIVKILFKIGFIYLFTSTSTGWAWFNKLFIDFFKNGIDYITFSVAENFDRVNAPEINAKIISGDFYNKGILFKSVDNVIDLLLTGAVQKKIMALLFSSIFGWVYFLILFNCLITYIYAIANSMLLYITCQIVVSILFTLGPIFFIFLMFKVTKDIFDNWIKALIGFSLQQIFLIMTLALFNSFVISFLKLALGYRVCWANILSLNIVITKVSLLNFWTVAGVNAPEGYSEESPEQSFGNDQNMPSLYLFLYLMIVVTLMKKFIEMFTNLAISLSGGLKASTIGADANQLGQKAFKGISKVASGIYERTVGRAVANIDNALFDSGKIADQKRSDKRRQFAEDIKTRASLMSAGNDAISKYKKENALEFAGLDNAQKREKLEEVKMNAMKEYAKENDIGDKKLDKLLNKSGLNYTGTNLFGAAYQAGTQAVYSGGNLFNSIRDKKIDTSFSKTEANATLKSMNETDQKAFLEKIEKGDAHVNKGKIEKIRSGAISAVKAPAKIAKGIGYAVLNPKTAIKNVASTAQSINPFKSNEVKKQAVEELKASGRIATFKTPIPLPNAVKNWARTDEEKKLIRDKMREISKDKGLGLEKDKMTSQSVIKDLKTTIDYTKNLKDSGGLKTEQAKAKRFAGRVANMFSKNEPKQTISDEKMTKRFENLKESGAVEISQLKSQKDNLGRALESVDSKLRSQDEFKKFNILEKVQKSLENTGGISKEIRQEISKTGDDSLNKFLQRNDELNNASRLGKYVANSRLGIALGKVYNKTLGKLPSIPGSKTVKNLTTYASSKVAQNLRLDHVKNSLKEEVASNPLLKETLDQRQQFRGELNEVNSKINSLEGRSANIDKREQAQKINETNLKTIQEYKDKPLLKRAGLAIASKATFIIRPLARTINSVTGNKIGYFQPFEGRENYKKAKKAVGEFKKLKTPEDFGNFVEKDKKN